MSMLLMVNAMRTKVGNPLRKLVLIKLADNANDHGECWPSYQHIADQCEISPRSVMRHIDFLCAAGLVRKEYRQGPKGNSSNLYTITLLGDTKSLGVVTQSHQGGDTKSPGGGDRESPRTSNSFEPINEPLNLGACAPVEDHFELAWKAYPKREGANPKNKALSAWNARIKEGVKPGAMVEGVKRYAAFSKDKGNTGTGYVMQAVRFFGTERAFENEWSVSSPAAASKHHGFERRDYFEGLTQREDGTYAL